MSLSTVIDSAAKITKNTRNPLENVSDSLKDDPRYLSLKKSEQLELMLLLDKFLDRHADEEQTAKIEQKIVRAKQAIARRHRNKDQPNSSIQ